MKRFLCRLAGHPLTGTWRLVSSRTRVQFCYCAEVSLAIRSVRGMNELIFPWFDQYQPTRLAYRLSIKNWS